MKKMFQISSLILVFLFSMFIHAHPTEAPSKKTKTYVLVHSAWLGAWQWQQVSKTLETAGHIVITPDLAGDGSDKTPASNITMETYVNQLLAILDGQPEKVVLVGHSFNGITVSRMAELRPKKIDRLVYLTAFLLPNGASFYDAVKGVPDSKAVEHFFLSEDQTEAFVKSEEMQNTFAHDIPAEVFNQAIAYIVPEPAAPLGYKLEVTDAVFGKIPKYYIEFTDDRAIPISAQRSIYEGKVEKVFTLNSSHTPNFSQPDKLAAILLEVIQ